MKAARSLIPSSLVVLAVFNCRQALAQEGARTAATDRAMLEAKALEDSEKAARLNELVLIGDARAQLGTTDSAGAATSFGGGILYRTSATFTMIKMSTSPELAELRDEAAAGSFILSPWNAKVAADVTFEWFPWARNLLSPKPLGFRGRFAIGGSNWVVGQEGAAAQTRKETAIALDLGVGTRSVFVSDSSNYVEAFVFGGPHVRVLGGDGGESFRRQLVDNDASGFYGGLLYGGLRLGRMEVAAQLSYTNNGDGDRIEGLSNLQFIVGVELRDGPVITGGRDRS